MIQQRPTQPARADLPTMYDLPSEDPEELGLPDEFHDFQPKLLRETCQPPDCPDFFIGADLNLYYDTQHTNWYKRPDWFLVIGAPASQSENDMRWSYVLWQEGIAPFLVVELLSPGTEAEDLGQTLRVVGKPPTKWQVYEQELQVPYYAVFDRSSNNFRLFQLLNSRYTEVTLANSGFWFPELQMTLGKWTGQYGGINNQWLRWFDRSHQLIPTAQEKADLESQRADMADRRADTADRKAERLAAQLRLLGIEPDIEADP
jgi:Uma2 family endonuclease